MNPYLSIEEFNDLLVSETDDEPNFEKLREFTHIDAPEQITQAVENGPMVSWF
jgi:hypothetical protein